MQPLLKNYGNGLKTGTKSCNPRSISVSKNKMSMLTTSETVTQAAKNNLKLSNFPKKRPSVCADGKKRWKELSKVKDEAKWHLHFRLLTKFFWNQAEKIFLTQVSVKTSDFTQVSVWFPTIMRIIISRPLYKEF